MLVVFAPREVPVIRRGTKKNVKTSKRQRVEASKLTTDN